MTVSDTYVRKYIYLYVDFQSFLCEFYAGSHIIKICVNSA